jgi:transposase
MPAKGKPMQTIREILRLSLTTALSDRQIARSVRCSHTTVARYAVLARQQSLDWSVIAQMPDCDLRRLLHAEQAQAVAAPEEQMPMPDWSHVHAELARKGVTLKLLWREYVEANPTGYRYSRFCDLYRTWSSQLDLTMRMRHTPGEKLYIDYAGTTVAITDPLTGQVSQAQIFVASMGYSHMIYAEATLSQQSDDWLASHVRTLEYFGGSPAVVVPDNLKSGITNPCRYDPEVNHAYRELAEYYGLAVIPARVRHPKDKSKVEKAVQIIEYEALAVLRDRRYFSIGALNTDLRELVERINNRPFQKIGGTRQSLFEEFDKPALRPLPDQRFIPATWSTARVGPDYHGAVDRQLYSVPYNLHGRQVYIRRSPTIVEVYHENKVVAAHPRSFNAHGYTTTIAEHMPSSHRRYAEWTPKRVLDWAATVGPATRALADHIMTKRHHPEQGFRTCMGLIALRRGYSVDRIESMATYALHHNVTRLKSMRHILEHGLDQVRHDETVSDTIIMHENIRGPVAYASIHPLFEETQDHDQPSHHQSA